MNWVSLAILYYVEIVYISWFVCSKCSRIPQVKIETTNKHNSVTSVLELAFAFKCTYLDKLLSWKELRPELLLMYLLLEGVSYMISVSY